MQTRNGTSLSFTGIGIASAGFPAKFTAAVFCRFNTRASKRKILPMSGIAGGSVWRVGKAIKSMAQSRPGYCDGSGNTADRTSRAQRGRGSELRGQLPGGFFAALDIIFPLLLASPCRAFHHQSPDFLNPDKWQPEFKEALLMVKE